MSNITTIRAMKSFIQSQIKEVDVIEGFDEDTTVDCVLDYLDNHGYEAPNVIYNQDAFEVVSGTAFNDYYNIDKIDFSGCESSLDALTLEANAILYNAYSEILNEMIKDYLQYA